MKPQCIFVVFAGLVVGLPQVEKLAAELTCGADNQCPNGLICDLSSIGSGPGRKTQDGVCKTAIRTRQDGDKVIHRPKKNGSSSGSSQSKNTNNNLSTNQNKGTQTSKIQTPVPTLNNVNQPTPAAKTSELKADPKAIGDAIIKIVNKRENLKERALLLDSVHCCAVNAIGGPLGEPDSILLQCLKTHPEAFGKLPLPVTPDAAAIGRAIIQKVNNAVDQPKESGAEDYLGVESPRLCVETFTKYAYNAIHPYFVPFVAVALLALRNSTPELRSSYLRLPSRLRRISLETYVLQYHIWLANDATSILSLGLTDRYGGLLSGFASPRSPVKAMARGVEACLLTAVFVGMAHLTHGATQALGQWIFGSGNSTFRSVRDKEKKCNARNVKMVEHRS
ncbi:hypothetical protein QQS21_006283 [Conoideocrella luteorostrata]|uniref:Cas1p 10 TM acyl transferase domain-containing protein n=1 Tax=Conoideocrella luteorostrata TaxID=1105319 RepID=A0AAJ0FT15_9HYPO|nr:hypothetical protein QQS21_006283 [Conoideocrella luteorostrata]